MLIIVLINGSISPRVPWAAGNSLTGAVLFSEAAAAGAGVRAGRPVGVLPLGVPGSAAGAPSPTRRLRGRGARGFCWPETRTLVLGKSQMKAAVEFVRTDVCVSVLVGTGFT